MLEPEKLYHAIVQAGEDWADKESAAELLEESKKSILAELVNDAPGSTVAAKEQLALADPAYKLHLKTMVAARKEANRARVRYDATKVLAELRRTQESTRRAEALIR